MFDIEDLYKQAQKAGVELSQKEKQLLYRGFVFAFECIGISHKEIDEVIKGKTHNVMRSTIQGSGWYFNEDLSGDHSHISDGVLIVKQKQERVHEKGLDSNKRKTT